MQNKTKINFFKKKFDSIRVNMTNSNSNIKKKWKDYKVQWSIIKCKR
jgi:hypothetical protein